MMKHTLKFLEAYKNDFTINSSEFSDNHEPTKEVPKYIDEDMRDFLLKLLSGNALNGKSMMFLGDHGLHMSPITQFTTSGQIEKFNPGLYLALPRKLADKYRDVLIANE